MPAASWRPAIPRPSRRRSRSDGLVQRDVAHEGAAVLSGAPGPLLPACGRPRGPACATPAARPAPPRSVWLPGQARPEDQALDLLAAPAVVSAAPAAGDGDGRARVRAPRVLHDRIGPCRLQIVNNLPKTVDTPPRAAEDACGNQRSRPVMSPASRLAGRSCPVSSRSPGESCLFAPFVLRALPPGCWRGRGHGAGQGAPPLLVYTALETDQLKAYQEGFKKVQP